VLAVHGQRAFALDTVIALVLAWQAAAFSGQRRLGATAAEGRPSRRL